MEREDDASAAFGYRHFWAKLKGASAVCAGLLFVFGCATLWYLNQHNAEMKASSDEVRREMIAERKTIEAAIWVVWACNKQGEKKECDSIDLARPEKISEMSKRQ